MLYLNNSPTFTSFDLTFRELYQLLLLMLAPGCDYRRRKHFNVIVIIGSSGIVGARIACNFILHVLDLDLKMKELLVRLQPPGSLPPPHSVLTEARTFPYRFLSARLCSVRSP